MATTVRGAFEDFASRLEPTANQTSDASTKQVGVRDCIERTMWTVGPYLFGSYARSTLIRPPQDIDLMIVMRADKHGDALQGSPGDLLAQFHSKLKSCYPDTPIRKDSPAVHLNFYTIGFDVVPAFERQGGGYFVPRPDGYGWLSTNPVAHAAKTTALNGATDGRFVPLAKMFKSWNVAHATHLIGFHLEVALANAWPQTRSVFSYETQPTKYDSYSRAAAALLPALAARLEGFHESDPAGLSGQIDGYLSWDSRRLTVERLKSDAGEAEVALRHEERGDHERAINKWRGIFGDPFPAYS